VSAQTLILPGLHGSSDDHWQTWMERRIHGAVRVEQRDWSDAKLDEWVAVAARAIDESPSPVWLIAHSFGCLVAAALSSVCGQRILGALLVAPANPERFSDNGLEPTKSIRSIAPKLPQTALDFPSVLIASTNDPWMRLTTASVWADRWGSHFVNLGAVGHINPASGFGAWPDGLALFHSMCARHEFSLQGDLSEWPTHTTSPNPIVASASRFAQRRFVREWLA
jgi:uncharacterized protein